MFFAIKFIEVYKRIYIFIILVYNLYPASSVLYLFIMQTLKTVNGKNVDIVVVVFQL